MASTLVSMVSPEQLEPELAESSKFSEDKLRVTLHCARILKWSDGHPSPDDVLLLITILF